MANLTTVGLTAGAGSSGTGSVSTLDNVIGTAGTPSAQVQTVQGIASMTALKVDGSAVTQPVSIATLPSGAVTNAGTFAVQADSTLAQNATTSGQKGILAQGAVTTASPTYTTSQTSPLSLDTSGNLRVNVVAGGAGGGVVTQSTAASLNATVVGTGTFPVQVTSATGLAQASATSGQTGSLVMGAATTSAPSLTTAQTNPLSMDLSGNLRVLEVNSANPIPAGTNVIGKVGVDATSLGVTNGVSLTGIGTTAIATGNGTSSAGAQRVAIVSDNTAFAVNATGVDQYATHKEIAASQTAAVLGATGAIGDYLAYVVVYPGVAACGVVTILDAASTVGTFAGGGTTPLPDLRPFTIPVGAFCTGAGWKITTGANVTVSGVGKFT